ncbi:MAG: hypothetical protein KDD43_08365 [Bdellovibrionales bacterium]|nr:hypothetical protein [Bdellovibrionales bacterium]
MRLGWKTVSIIAAVSTGMMAVGETPPTPAPTDERTVVTMKDDRGRVRTFTEASPSEIAAIFDTPLNDANAFVMRARHADCKKVDQDLELQAGYLMELPFIIETLNDSKVPILSGSQKETLSRVPLCEPYLLDLKIIANQLNGWKLEKKETPTTLGKEKQESDLGDDS